MTPEKRPAMPSTDAPKKRRTARMQPENTLRQASEYYEKKFDEEGKMVFKFITDALIETYEFRNTIEKEYLDIAWRLKTISDTIIKRKHEFVNIVNTQRDYIDHSLYECQLKSLCNVMDGLGSDMFTKCGQEVKTYTSPHPKYRCLIERPLELTPRFVNYDEHDSAIIEDVEDEE